MEVPMVGMEKMLWLGLAVDRMSPPSPSTLGCSLLGPQDRVTNTVTITPPAPPVLLISMKGSMAVGAGECWWMERGRGQTPERGKVMVEVEVILETVLVVQVSSSLRWTPFRNGVKELYFLRIYVSTNDVKC